MSSFLSCVGLDFLIVGVIFSYSAVIEQNSMEVELTESLSFILPEGLFCVFCLTLTMFSCVVKPHDVPLLLMTKSQSKVAIKVLNFYVKFQVYSKHFLLPNTALKMNYVTLQYDKFYVKKLLLGITSWVIAFLDMNNATGKYRKRKIFRKSQHIN